MSFIINNISSLSAWAYRLLDALTPFSVLYIAALSYNNIWSDKYLILGILGGLFLILFSQATGAYSYLRGISLFSGVKQVIQAWGVTWLALLAIAFLIKDSSYYSRVILTSWFIATPFVLLIYRITLRSILGQFRTIGWNEKKVAILGSGSLGRRLAKTLLNAKTLGYMPYAFYDDDTNQINKTYDNISVIASIDSLLATNNIEDMYDEIYITLPLRAERRIKQILNSLSNTSIVVKFIPDCFAFDLMHSQISDIEGIPIISVYDTPLNSATNKLVKRLEDLLLSSLIVLIISPLLIFLALGIKLTSKGPILFKQKRVGWNGKEFTIYKFRSMPVNTDEHLSWGGAQSKTTTKFGSFIRKTSIDELPQFFNVLMGEMSIVGPRPERKFFVEKFRAEVPRYMQKHMVKAGITGWAQVHGWRGDTSIEKRVEFDLLYIDNWSLWLDIKIILLTIIKGFINKNAC